VVPSESTRAAGGRSAAGRDEHALLVITTTIEMKIRDFMTPPGTLEP
jgi:hypothetical protein